MFSSSCGCYQERKVIRVKWLFGCRSLLRGATNRCSHARSCLAPVKHLWISRPSASPAQNRSRESFVQLVTRAERLSAHRQEEKEDAQTVTPYRRSGHIDCCAARLGSVGLLGPTSADAHARPRLLGFRL